jgi:hypothetical protein
MHVRMYVCMYVCVTVAFHGIHAYIYVSMYVCDEELLKLSAGIDNNLWHAMLPGPSRYHTRTQINTRKYPS